MGTSTDHSSRTKGGTQIQGDASVQGGDFIARDKVIQNINLDVEKLVRTLKQALPEGDPAPQYLLDTLKSFRNFHAALFEWKEVHNFLNDVLFMFGPFTLEIDHIEMAREKPNTRLLGQLWRPISQKVNALVEWAKTIQHIDEPFIQSEQGLQGPAWAVDMFVAKEHIDQLLKSSRVEKEELFDARGEFGEKAETHMYLADKKLRETADELYSLSRVVLGSLSHE